jgi:alkanesulfonate monooxygenase SsuD/methylene tetrahydromethanopterin reductase-like flavin-dependent oxidoreductase (luciferase family)
MYPDYTSRFPELGFYGLPGHTRSPRDILKQVQDAEALGVGNVMISERPDYKEIASICGACAAVTENIFIGTSGTNLNTRHPVITASMGSTLHSLSEGRFALGLAKGMAMRWKAWGVDHPTFAREREFVELMRRMWKGETIAGHDGALGKFGQVGLAPYIDVDIPILYVGFGPKSLEHAGQIYDGAHLHTFMSDQALTNAVAQVRSGEKARLTTYLQIPGYGDMLVAINGWDPEILQRFRTHPSVTSVGGLIDSVASTQQIAEIEKLIPQAWRPAAVGNARQCAERWLDQFKAGADGIIIHASTPEEFAPVLEEYAKIRPAELFEGRTNRPG